MTQINQYQKSTKSCSKCQDKTFSKIDPELSNIEGHRNAKRSEGILDLTQDDVRSMGLSQRLDILSFVNGELVRLKKEHDLLL